MNYIKQSLCLILCFICSCIYAQQITVDNNVTPQDLVENTLIQGCAEVSNISSPSNGGNVGLGSFGYFERGLSNFPFENGIVLTTGDANSAGNGQNTAILNDGDDSWTKDADLESALGISGTLNATSLEFDFISISNTIQFNYILASEEYFGNFPCQYSDGFAFLIREAGTNNPYTNIAIVPGTSTPVNTNTVHDEIVGFCQASNESFFEGYNVGDTNYNGRTTVLTAVASIQPNVQYQIKLIIADQTDENYDSAVFIEGNSFNATVDLGEDFSTCASDVLLNGDIQNPQATYTWLLNGVIISGETQPTYTAIQSGNYRVVAEIPLNGGICLIEDDININLSSTQSSDPISDFEICDDLSNGGIETFDLSIKDAEVLASVPASSYTISYHYTSTAAQNSFNPITSPIQNTTNPQVVHVRIEDTTNGCLAFSTINLVVNALPNIVDPSPLDICDDQTADGFTTIDLSVKDDEITNGQANTIVTYHSTVTDAANGANALPMPYVNTNSNEQVFVRVQNSQTGCVSTTTLDINVLDNPVINTNDHYIDACDADHDGFADFDLTSVIPDVLQGFTNVTVTFHETNEDALSGANPIVNETNYSNININEQIVFIRVESSTTGCASVTPIELHTNLLLSGTTTRDISICDLNNDGSEEFNFGIIATDFIHNIPDVAIEFYETPEDRDNQLNAIDQSTPYIPLSNPQTIYIGLFNSTCYDVDEFEISINAIQEFPAINDQTVCDEDQDGFTNLRLAEFNSLVTAEQTGFQVRYFLTEDDASNNTNALNPYSYQNTSNPFTVFTRVTSNQTGCASNINSFEILVLPAPEATAPADIIICDDDQDGFYNINLLDVITDIVSNTNNRIISFYNSLSDAENNINAITNESNYNAQTETVYLRIENSNTGCYSIQTLKIIINTIPILSTISDYNYTICEDNSDGIAEFLFNTKDAEILNGQSGKQVLYYTNQNDADNRVNEINKDIEYQNISNPQTIFVRVENLTDENCYNTSNFEIEVGSNPLYNTPSDWFMCDSSNNDGIEIFDLNTKIDEISSGIDDNLTITFYTSQYNAENGINPISSEFTNTVNPQQIFVQIDNGNICKSITSFEVNVIQLPEVNASIPLVTCDTDYDGLTEVNLTLAEFDIIGVRQDDIQISYFENIDDLESNINNISNPDSFNNITNPQMVYIKITNTNYNCYVSARLDIIVNAPPVINDFQTYNICENETNSFDLNEINESLMDESFNVLFTYYTSLADAENSTNALDTNYTYSTNNDTLFARVEFSTTHCFTIYEFNLNVNPLPVANQPEDVMICDDDFDGLYEFDLTQHNTSILGGQNPSQFTITYYNTESDANEGLSNIDTTYMAFDGEVIYARIENNTTGCYDITQFMTLINPLPIIDLEDQVICLDNLPLLVSANTNNPTDSYLWSTGEITPEIEITETGTYWVTVTTEFGCENTRVFGVSESESAIIEATEIVDFSDPNNITVTISGSGDYLYQLDDGEPQESNFFNDVAMGYHTITIIDVNGCAEVTKEVLVIDIPKHMTPNNDGQFDTWHIIGVETLPGTIIHIFDRYGKLVKQLGSNTPGWDGTYKGTKMPASDYWFVAEVKQGGIAFEVKGHFTIRR
ncbi:choice-of-anchor L domain-containing protein [Winogradskyella sp.]|uniref:choice-of-anchor L domain-containing protein n=1 Tax=Winogradskyella sp. TaxID=1883156 RepID=UPI003F6B25C7